MTGQPTEGESAASPPGLALRGISVVRSGARVLDSVTVSVARRETVVVIGPNGAGKTTLLEAAAGSVPLAGGEILVRGHPPRSFADRARSMGFLLGEAEPAAEARVRTLLDQPGIDAAWARELEGRLGLTALRSARAGALSRGERRRLLLFEALAQDKPLLLLDEPTGVFDPLQLLDVVALFRAAAQRGAGLLVTVHQMSDAEALGSRIVILNRGRVVAEGPLDALRERAGLQATSRLQDVFVALLRQEGADAPA
jgi:ABC-type multidrug transport system ATPase subunit